MSPTVLNQRLRDLREAGVVVLEEPGGYALSQPGRELLQALLPLHQWAEKWHKKLAARADAQAGSQKSK